MDTLACKLDHIHIPTYMRLLRTYTLRAATLHILRVVLASSQTNPGWRRAGVYISYISVAAQQGNYKPILH